MTCRRRGRGAGWLARVDHLVPGERGRLRPGHRRSTRPDRLIPEAAAQCGLWFPPRKIPLEIGTPDLVAGASD